MLMGEDPVINQNNTIRRSKFIEDPTMSNAGLTLASIDHKHDESDSSALGKLGRFIGAFDPLNAIRAVQRTYKKVKGEPVIEEIENDDRVADTDAILMSTGCDPQWEEPDTIEKPSLSRTFSMATLRKARSELSLFPRNKLGTPSATPSKRYSAESISNASVKSIKHQRKLTKRISDLETQLEMARRELHSSISATSLSSAAAHETYIPKFKLTQSRARSAFIPGSLPTLPSESLLLPNTDKPLPSEPNHHQPESYKYLSAPLTSLEDPFVSQPDDPPYIMSSLDVKNFNDPDGPYTLKISEKAPSECSQAAASNNESESTNSTAECTTAKRNDSMQESLPESDTQTQPPSPFVAEYASLGSASVDPTAPISISSSPITVASSGDANTHDRVSSRGSEIVVNTDPPTTTIKRKPVAKTRKRRSLEDEDRTYRPEADDDSSDSDVWRKRKRKTPTKKRGPATKIPQALQLAQTQPTKPARARVLKKPIVYHQSAKAAEAQQITEPVQAQQPTQLAPAQALMAIVLEHGLTEPMQARNPADAVQAQQHSMQLVPPPEPAPSRRSFDGQVGTLEAIEEEQSSVSCSSPVVKDFAAIPRTLPTADQGSQACSTSDVMESVEKDHALPNGQGDPAKVDRTAASEASSGDQESILSKNGKMPWEWPDFVF